MDETGEDYRTVKNMLFTYEESDVDLSSLSDVKVRKQSQVTLPTGFHLLDDGDTVLGRRARAYLEKRGFNISYLSSRGFGYVDKRPPIAETEEDQEDDYFGYIIIPFVKDNLLYYFIARDYIDNFLRYKNPPYEKFGVGKSELLFNEDCLKFYDTIFVVEGWACAVTLGDNAVAILGSSFSTEQLTKLIASPCTTVVIVSDLGFYKHGLKMALELLDYKEEVYALDLAEIDPDVYDIKYDPEKPPKDPNDFGRDPIIDLWSMSKPIGLEDLVRLM
jgi:hypothetical protein